MVTISRLSFGLLALLMHSSLWYRMSSARASSNKEEEKYAQCWQHTITGLVSEVLSIRETIVWGSRPGHLDHLTKRCNLPLYLICMLHLLKAGHSSNVHMCWSFAVPVQTGLSGGQSHRSCLAHGKFPLSHGLFAFWLSMSETLPRVSCSTSSIK